MVVTKGEIKRYLRKELRAEEEDSIKKDFILDKIAQGIKRSQPLPKNARCQICGRYMDRLVPVQMKVCKGCAIKFFNNAGFLRVVGRPQFEEWYCDNCLGKCWNPIVVNPYVCEICARKIGGRHERLMPKLKVRIVKEMNRWKLLQM